MKTSRRLHLGSVLLLGVPLIAISFAASAFTQQSGGPFTIHPSATTGGGGVSSSCTKRVAGSIGQSSLGTSSGGPFAVESGFWPNTITCPLALSPTTQFFATAGGAGSTNVIATGSCGWTALVSVDWITLTSSDTGLGNEVVTFEVRENFTGSARQAAINVGGVAQLVVQDAGLGDDCNYSINPQFQSFPASGGSGTISVSSEDRCAWQAVPTASWITITSQNVGVGNGSISFCVEANPGAGRAESVIIGGRSFAVKQKGN
jgi:hypothetical protein